jgi:hypothetical protein
MFRCECRFCWWERFCVCNEWHQEVPREISKADDIREDYVKNNKIGVTSIRRLLDNLYVRWRRGKAEEKVEDYLIKHLKSSTKRQSYIEKIQAFRLQGEATHEWHSMCHLSQELRHMMWLGQVARHMMCRERFCVRDEWHQEQEVPADRRSPVSRSARPLA